MKQFFKWVGKHIAGAIVFSLFSILFIAGIVYALTYPSAPPTGEVAGGKFMQYFNQIVNICPVGEALRGFHWENASHINIIKNCIALPIIPTNPVVQPLYTFTLSGTTAQSWDAVVNAASSDPRFTNLTFGWNTQCQSSNWSSLSFAVLSNCYTWMCNYSGMAIGVNSVFAQGETCGPVGSADCPANHWSSSCLGKLQ